MAEIKKEIKTVVIDRMDRKGNGSHFRFFAKGKDNVILTAKAVGNGNDFAAGQSVAISNLVELQAANAEQLKRYNGVGAITLDTSLLA